MFNSHPKISPSGHQNQRMLHISCFTAAIEISFAPLCSYN